MAVVLITYQDKRRAGDGSRIDTTREIIERWAPSVENDTESYVKSVSVALGKAPDDATVDVHDYATMLALVKAIIQHENGVMPYSATELDEGLKLAGVVSGKSPAKTPVGAAVATATVSGAVAAAVEGANQVGPVVAAINAAAAGIAGFGQYLRIIGAALVVLSLAASAYAYWRHSRQIAAVKA